MEEIKKLREQTGAGISDCKKALEEASGDLEKAVEILRKKGISKAAKRGDRETSEGIILLDLSADKKQGYILQINSETDFVARNEQFQKFSQNVLDLIKKEQPADLEELLSKNFNNGTVKEELDNLSGVIGEKLEIKNMAVLDGDKVAAYSHLGGRIGVLVSFQGEITDELARDIAMQIAAAKPKYIQIEEVPVTEIEKEKDIYREQLKKEGKPDEIIEKILEGKINKYFEEVCLLKQEFIKDEKQKIENILEGAKVEKFVRYSLGQ